MVWLMNSQESGGVNVAAHEYKGLRPDGPQALQGIMVLFPYIKITTIINTKDLPKENIVMSNNSSRKLLNSITVSL